MKYWLMKSEPDAYSIDDLKRDKTSLWDGVRNYQARNFMMNEMSVGDSILFYHSNAKPPGVAGLATVSRPAQPDPSAQNKKSKYYDPKSTPEKPIWHCVEVKYKKKLKRLVSLEEIKDTPALAKMTLIKRGVRLSIQPVSKTEYDHIVAMSERPREGS